MDVGHNPNFRDVRGRALTKDLCKLPGFSVGVGQLPRTEGVEQEAVVGSMPRNWSPPDQRNELDLRHVEHLNLQGRGEHHPGLRITALQKDPVMPGEIVVGLISHQDLLLLNIQRRHPEGPSG